MPKKTYLFIDETGQDTNGKLYILALVLLSSQLDNLRNLLKEIERDSGKYLKKWQKTRNIERQAYIKRVLDKKEFQGCLFYSYYQNSGREYLPLLIYSIANIIGSQVRIGSPINITIDALNKKEKMILKLKLRHFHFKIEKVVGKRDQSDPLLRLADALAGFIRDGIENHPKVKNVFNQAIKDKKIQEIK